MRIGRVSVGRPLAVAIALLLAVAVPRPAAALDLARQPIVLLGEVHDNGAQHALRLEAFRALLATGARPALLLEQIDRDHQAAIDALRAQPAVPTADDVIAAAKVPGGWNWAFYRPFLHEALAHRLPIVAANVSRSDARRAIGEGLAAIGFDAAVPSDVLQAQAAAIEASHCGLVDGAQARRMASAQIARDQFMARMVALHAARGVVLLAGNGHVRRDIGVPRWLAADLRARTMSVGFVEADEAGQASAYDEVVRTPAQARSDPCEAMRQPPSLITPPR